MSEKNTSDQVPGNDSEKKHLVLGDTSPTDKTNDNGILNLTDEATDNLDNDDTFFELDEEIPSNKDDEIIELNNETSTIEMGDDILTILDESSENDDDIIELKNESPAMENDDDILTLLDDSPQKENDILELKNESPAMENDDDILTLLDDSPENDEEILQSDHIDYIETGKNDILSPSNDAAEITTKDSPKSADTDLDSADSGQDDSADMEEIMMLLDEDEPEAETAPAKPPRRAKDLVENGYELGEALDSAIEIEASENTTEKDAMGMALEYVPGKEETNASVTMTPPVSPEQIEAALERVIERKLGDKIDQLLTTAIEKAVSQEIKRLKRLLTDNQDI